MRETSDQIKKGSTSSSPSEAHEGWWEGLGLDGAELALYQVMSP